VLPSSERRRKYVVFLAGARAAPAASRRCLLIGDKFRRRMRSDNGTGARLSVADRPSRGATVDQSHGDGGRGDVARRPSLDFRALHAVGVSHSPTLPAGETAAQS